MKAPEAPISAELLMYCPLPENLPSDRKEAIRQQAENNRIIANCYIRQKNLVDAVIRRKETQ